MESIESRCISAGLRMTGHRRIIARVLSEATDHPDAESIHQRVAEQDPRVSLATVYRTMRIFEDAGVVERLDFRDGRARYEDAEKEHHDHLIDITSGEVVEFMNQEIERLQAKVAEELGYKLVAHRLELYAVSIDRENPVERSEG